MILYIKNMVCRRCKMVVASELEKLGVKTLSVELGEVELQHPIDAALKDTLAANLYALGFELIDDKKSKIIERIKSLIIELVHSRDNDLKTNLSQYLSSEIGQEYSALSNLFSEVEGTTIEKYLIAQKIEKVKELLTYDELSLSEIAYQLNYSSVAYLSNQFRKVTGFSPTYFKNLKDRKRKQIEDL
ncbi:helix-turn-helix domain-containing protein [Flavobacterium terrisoli]|uniref:helix-turn-helix domain-containing protein n=1 Tax=Flavobacterium terrisoli TaxID=3242195 RepID=UPI002543A94E|nr:AraC family transcriptional regulator [Flavobacterium buctense]